MVAVTVITSRRLADLARPGDQPLGPGRCEGHQGRYLRDLVRRGDDPVP